MYLQSILVLADQQLEYLQLLRQVQLNFQIEVVLLFPTIIILVRFVSVSFSSVCLFLINKFIVFMLRNMILCCRCTFMVAQLKIKKVLKHYIIHFRGSFLNSQILCAASFSQNYCTFQGLGKFAVRIFGSCSSNDNRGDCID